MSVGERELEKSSRRGWQLTLPGQWLRKAWGWVDERTGFAAPLRNFFTYPVPLYVHRNLLYSLGGLSLISLSLQLGTGLLLTFYYDPGVDSAYNSVDYITYQMPAGWLVRGLHYYNASVLVVLVVLHMLRTFSVSAYKKPREITWLSGLLMLLTVLAFAFTGALLPWDQSGYWATKVGAEIAGATPVFGNLIKRLLQGGATLGQATLTRFYVLHVLLLPLGVLGLITLHIHQLRYHGVSPAMTAKGQALSRKFVPFFPHWMTVDATLGLGMLLALVLLSWMRRAPLRVPRRSNQRGFHPPPTMVFSLPLPSA